MCYQYVFFDKIVTIKLNIASNVYEGLSYIAANTTDPDAQKRILYIMMKPILDQFQNVRSSENFLNIKEWTS
jgi:hypothetical protein